jgi:hypothetical protein
MAERLAAGDLRRGLPAVRLDRLAGLVNEYGTRPRAVAGEASHSPG